MNDPRSSNGRGGAAKQATTTVSDLGCAGWRCGKTSERSHVEGGTPQKIQETMVNISHAWHNRRSQPFVSFFSILSFVLFVTFVDNISHMHGIIGEAEISCPFSFVFFVDFVDNIYVLLST